MQRGYFIINPKKAIYFTYFQGRIIKTTNVVCEFIITSDKEFFEKIGEEETKRYFQTAYDFVTQYHNLGEQYIISASVHMDESTPHMHLIFVPVIHKTNKNGEKLEKIACSEYWKGKDSYRKLQNAFYKYVTDNSFKLERGEQRGSKHINPETLKQITNYDNINQKEVNQLETKNTALIVQQNKELIEYTNKLKLQLSKLLATIQYNNKLYQENITLKRTNAELNA